MQQAELQKKLEEVKGHVLCCAIQLEQMIANTPTGKLREELTTLNIHTGIAYVNLKSIKLEN